METITRFRRELSGDLGLFWKRHAEEEIERMRARVDNGEIGTDSRGGVFWNSNGNYLPDECAEILGCTGFPFSLEETTRAREAQAAAQIEAYRRDYKGPGDEELLEMRAAFGSGAVVIDVISGEQISL